MYMCVHLCVHLCFHVRVWRPETNFGYFSPWLCTILFRVGTFTKLRSCFLSRLTDWLDSNLLESACLCFPDQCSYRATLPRLAFVLVSEIWTQVLVLVLQTFLSTESFPQHHFMHIFFFKFLRPSFPNMVFGYVYLLWIYMYVSEDNLSGVDSLLPGCGSTRANSGYQTWQLASLGGSSVAPL